MSALWMSGHLPAAAGVGVAVSHSTGLPALGLAAGVASHYLLDAMTPWQLLDRPNHSRVLDWLGAQENLLLVASADCLIGWGLVTAIGIIFHQDQEGWLFWLYALMGFWPDLDKAPVFKMLFRVTPFNLLAYLHEKLHWWRTPNPWIVIPGWIIGLASCYLILLAAVR
jgi:hypothetical protein